MVLGNPGDGRSGIVFRAVVHFMEAASKKVLECWLLQVTSGSLSLGEQIEVSHRPEPVKTGANCLYLKWLVETYWEFHTSTAFDVATVARFSG